MIVSRLLAVIVMIAAFASAALSQEARHGWKSMDETRSSWTYWTSVTPDGRSAWRDRVTEILRSRGFSDEQIKRFSRLNVRLDEVRTAMGAGKPLEFTVYALPVRYSPETGFPMPLDPDGYAWSLPSCLATDERACEMRYSIQHANEVGDLGGFGIPCVLPKRTVAFCKRVGFGNAFAKRQGLDADFESRLREQAKGEENPEEFVRFQMEARAQISHWYVPSCGEDARGSGCGADLLVFDDPAKEEAAQTKLQFDFEMAVAAAPPAVASGAPAPADPQSFPKIVYRVSGDASFGGREGPAEPEDWEHDPEALAGLKDLPIETRNARIGEIVGETRERGALRFCWPHAVFHPCDLE